MSEPEDPKFGNSHLINVGRLPGINTYNDPGKAFSNYKQNLMRVIDLIPVYFTIDVTNIFKNDVVVQQQPIVLDFVRGVREFQMKTDVIKLQKYTGIRAWVTNETNSQDEIQNNYKENKIVEAYNAMLDTFSKERDYIKSIGLGTQPHKGIPNPLAASLIDGRHLSLPRIWEKSDYNPSLSLTVKLNSPYGNDQSFIRNIAKPLLYIMALVSPSSYDGITYGLPPYIMVRAYGVTYMTLATADSISITRGGSDVRVNAAKQPLEISVSMSFKPALPGFGAMLTTDIADITHVDDPVGNEDVDWTWKSIPGITTLGSVIQSLRPVEKVAEAYPVTLEPLRQYMDDPPSPISSASPPLQQRSSVFIDPEIQQALSEVGMPIPDGIQSKIQSTV